MFPPEYVPHGVKLKYDGVPVDLTTEQEEVATMFAAMLETDYVTQKKEQFMKNFWIDFKHVLGPKHVIKTLDKCDFRDIYNHLMEEREAKKSLSKEVRGIQLLNTGGSIHKHCTTTRSRLDLAWSPESLAFLLDQPTYFLSVLVMHISGCCAGENEVEGGERNSRSKVQVCTSGWKSRTSWELPSGAPWLVPRAGGASKDG